MADPYLLQTTLWLPDPPEKAFAFFADAMNLEEITPPWLSFQIVTPTPIDMKPGALIDYRLRLHGIPIKWRTEIAEWNPPFQFVDQQLRGPYKLWRHTHRFESVDGGTLVTDRVRYIPRGGALIHRLFVRPDLLRIFTYRQDTLARLLGRDQARVSPVTIGPGGSPC